MSEENIHGDLTAEQIRYLHAADTGVELVIGEDSRLSYPLHNHASVFTVGMILSGNIQLTLGERTFSISENQTFFIPPYVPHKINAKSRYTMISLCVHKDVMAQISASRLIFITAFLLDKAFDSKPIDRLQTIIFLKAVTFYQRQACAQTAAADYVENVKRLIEQYPEYSLTAEVMSRYTYVSKYHLIRSFKQATGLTPHQFQIQNRVRKAQRLLVQPLSMTEVALTAGFFDQSHLNRCFKKIVGLTPSGYQAAYQIIRML
jgi:AraC-like DNA-binding protein/quercetin dioxygenase-like cupin family protein